jgi:endonuclease/exonuclease/phosphatase (EEP) superfamily protein YafD
MLAAATAVLCALSLAGFLARWTQPFEILSHFRFQYAAAATAATCLLALLRAPRASAAAAGLFLLNATAIATSLVPAAPVAHSRSSSLRIVWANLQRSEHSLASVADLVRAERADIVALTELPDERGDQAVRRAFTDFACFTTPRGQLTSFTTMIVSRWPCARSGDAAGFLERRSDAAYVDVGSLRVVAAHPRPPWDNERTAERDRVIRAGLLLAASAPRTVFVGDFNASAWSPIMIDLSRAGFRRALCGAPFASTWRSARPLFGLTIDHAYLHGDAAVANCRVGPGIGSDHWPLILDVAAADR